MRRKSIDPISIKSAIKSGQLELIIKKNIVYIRDTECGDTVAIGDVESASKENDDIWS